jgi:hypothetical protein
VGWQAVGAGYDYNIHQVQISGIFDLDVGLKAAFTVRPALGLEFKKASTSLAGISPIFRVEMEVQKHPGILGFVGAQIPF